jgi:hypothetical protein
VTMQLNEVRGLDPYRSKMRVLGLQTTDDLSALAHASPQALSSYLGAPIDEIVSFLPIVSQALTATQHETLNVPCPVDADVVAHLATSLRSTESLSLTDAPVGNVNLLDQMPPIRGQGNRNTCVAFASVATYEHYLNISGNPVALSEQYVYCKCKMSDGHYASGGSSILFAFSALRNFGCCPLQEWPYDPVQDLTNEGQCPPPGGADADAAVYRLGSAVSIPPRAVGVYRNFIFARRCVAFGFPVFESSRTNIQARLTGNFVNPIPNETWIGNHALCAMGYMDLPDRSDLGGGVFLIRNSWWPGWATESNIAPGYGTISYYYVANYATQACAIAPS